MWSGCGWWTGNTPYHGVILITVNRFVLFLLFHAHSLCCTLHRLDQTIRTGVFMEGECILTVTGLIVWKNVCMDITWAVQKYLDQSISVTVYSFSSYLFSLFSFFFFFCPTFWHSHRFDIGIACLCFLERLELWLPHNNAPNAPILQRNIWGMVQWVIGPSFRWF